MYSQFDFLTFPPTVDGALRAIAVFILVVVLVLHSTVFEAKYSDKLAQLYLKPWWRLLLVLLTIAALTWCPRVGILVALVLFFYFSDIETLITPNAPKKLEKGKMDE